VYADDQKICVAKHRDEAFAFAYNAHTPVVILLMGTSIL
jgi:hypothetical protein